MPDEQQLLSSKDFEVNAFDVLDKAQDYDTGVNDLISAYSAGQYDDPNDAKRVLAEYSDDLRRKFKAPGYSDEELLAVLPVKPDSTPAEITDPVERVNYWEASNISRIEEDNDPDAVAKQLQLKQQIQEYASRARRDILGNRGEGAMSWAVDKFYRAAESAVGPIANSFVGEALDIDGSAQALIERTDPKRDKDVSSKIASIAGAIAPIAATSLLPGGQGAAAAGVIGLQTQGSMSEMYQKSMEATGDPAKAMEAAGLIGVANLAGMVPAGKIVTESGIAIKQALLGTIEKEVADETVAKTLIASLQASKKSALGVATDTLSMGAAGATAGVIAKKGQNIGFDTNQNLTDDVVSDFLATAAIGGAFSAAHAVVENTYISMLQNKFKTFDEDKAAELADKAAKPEDPTQPKKAAKPAKKLWYKDDEGYDRPFREDSTAETRKRDTEDYNETASDYINEPYNDDPNIIQNELGHPVEVPQEPDVVVTLEGRTEAPKIQENLAASEKFNQAKTDIDQWTPEIKAKAYENLALQKEIEYMERRLAEAKAKEESGEKVEKGPTYREQIEKYEKDIADLKGELGKQDEDTLKNVDVIRQYEEARRELGKPPKQEKAPLSEGEKILAGRGIIGTENPTIGSSPAAVLLSKYITSSLKLARNIFDGAFGVFEPAKGSIRLLRSLGTSPEHFYSTLAHEIGHAVRFYMEDFAKGAGAQSPALRKFVQDWHDMFNMLKSSWDSLDLRFQLQEASKEWRPGWDENVSEAYTAYRSNPEESFADAFSYLVNAPGKFKERFPDLNKRFEEVLSESPHLDEFWNRLQKIALDPKEGVRFSTEVQGEARQMMGEKAKMAVEERQAEKTIENSLKQKLDAAYQWAFNKFNVAKRAIKSWPEAVTHTGYEIFNNIARGGAVYERIQRTFERPMKALLAKFAKTGIDPNLWAQYEAANKLLNDTTLTMARVREQPDLYLQAAKLIKQVLLQQKGVSARNSAKTGVEDIFDFDRIHTPEDINDALAQVSLIGDTAQVLKFDDFLARQDPKDPRAKSKALREYHRAMASLERRKESLPIENVRKAIEKMEVTDELPQTVKDAALDAISPNAFAARKYLVNPLGRTKYDAQAEIAFVKNELGPKFSELQSVSAEFHKITNSIMPDVIESGIFTPELIERIQRNSDNYVTNAVLEYFEGNDSIDSKVRTAIGSLKETGNELVATYLKSQAILERAYRQRAINSAVKLAKMQADLIASAPEGAEREALRKGGDITVEKVEHGRPGVDIFALRDKLSRKDNKHSYLVEYKNGKPTLYKISGGKGFENMFHTVRSIPALEPVLYLADQLSKALLVRQFKTTFSPTFTLFQKFYDRKLEALLSNSREITFGLPVHTGKALRSIDAQTLGEIAHYKKTGELTGNLKKLVDFDGAALDESMFQQEGIDSKTSATNALYEMFGTEMPNENTKLERIGIWTDEKLRNTLGKFWDSIGLGPDTAARDELRTKVNGFAIGKAHGMSDSEASVFARERFGIPDPTGGGIAAPMINRMFLFGRAHLNGLRVLGSFLVDTPKIASMQIAYRVLLPKVLMLSPIMVPVMKALFGQEEADKYDLFLNTVGRMEKISKNLIPLGWQDGTGQFHNFFDVKFSDIQGDWKPWYIRLPQSREITSLTKVFFPFLENMFDPKKAIAQSAQGIQSELTGNIQPVIQYMSNVGAMVMGKNPEDFYRMKPIFSQELQASGSPIEKGLAYAKYLGAAHVPTVFPYNPFSTTNEPKSSAEYAMQRAPFVGPMLRSLVGTSTYGQVENAKELQAQEQAVQAGIKRSVSDETQDLISNYRAATSKVSSLGKGWEEKVGPDVAAQIHFLLSWHTRVWVPYQHEMEQALANDDTERYQFLLEELGSMSPSVLSELRSMASKASE